jgi:hypothetical protein
MMTVRLNRHAFSVDVWLREMNGRWLAAADTPDGPSQRVGSNATVAQVALKDEGLPARSGPLSHGHATADN